eukprot:TRINITY_DN51107_c0_g1_i1.p1 TRINITY_DN51107_c0_g1~~TRINITY_DN51107_c0_g1_i1.p1  ORF type:complete len:955 (+),score=224.53 TRINITY_DN51107_c0_g1_i1:80-2944(+)
MDTGTLSPFAGLEGHGNGIVAEAGNLQERCDAQQRALREQGRELQECRDEVARLRARVRECDATVRASGADQWLIERVVDEESRAAALQARLVESAEQLRRAEEAAAAHEAEAAQLSQRLRALQQERRDDCVQAHSAWAARHCVGDLGMLRAPAAAALAEDLTGRRREVLELAQCLENWHRALRLHMANSAPAADGGESPAGDKGLLSPSGGQRRRDARGAALMGREGRRAMDSVMRRLRGEATVLTANSLAQCQRAVLACRPGASAFAAAHATVRNLVRLAAGVTADRGVWRTGSVEPEAVMRRLNQQQRGRLLEAVQQMVICYDAVPRGVQSAHAALLEELAANEGVVVAVLRACGAGGSQLADSLSPASLSDALHPLDSELAQSAAADPRRGIPALPADALAAAAGGVARGRRGAPAQPGAPSPRPLKRSVSLPQRPPPSAAQPRKTSPRPPLRRPALPEGAANGAAARPGATPRPSSHMQQPGGLRLRGTSPPATYAPRGRHLPLHQDAAGLPPARASASTTRSSASPPAVPAAPSGPVPTPAFLAAQAGSSAGPLSTDSGAAASDVADRGQPPGRRAEPLPPPEVAGSPRRQPTVAAAPAPPPPPPPQPGIGLLATRTLLAATPQPQRAQLAAALGDDAAAERAAGGGGPLLPAIERLRDEAEELPLSRLRAGAAALVARQSGESPRANGGVQPGGAVSPGSPPPPHRASPPPPASAAPPRPVPNGAPQQQQLAPPPPRTPAGTERSGCNGTLSQSCGGSAGPPPPRAQRVPSPGSQRTGRLSGALYSEPAVAPPQCDMGISEDERREIKEAALGSWAYPDAGRRGAANAPADPGSRAAMMRELKTWSTQHNIQAAAQRQARAAAAVGAEVWDDDSERSEDCSPAPSQSPQHFDSPLRINPPDYSDPSVQPGASRMKRRPSDGLSVHFAAGARLDASPGGRSPAEPPTH